MSDPINNIRVAILCKGFSYEKWEADCIKEVLSLKEVVPVLLISDAESFVDAPKGISKIRKYPFRNLFWRIYSRLKLKIPEFENVSLENELKNVPIIRCKTELRGKYSRHFSNSDIEIIKSHKPDIILRFAFDILRGEILTVAQYGVWSFHHADEQVIRGGPAAFWEIYNHNPVTGAILQRLTEKLDAGIILRKGYFSTIFHSHKENLEQLIEGTNSWMKQAILDIVYNNSPALSGKAVETNAPVYHFPKNYQMLRFRRKQLFNKFRFHLRELFQPEDWNIGVVNQTAEDVLQNGLKSELYWLPESKSGEYAADPFGWEENGKLKIVFEKYSYKNQKGILATTNKEGNSNKLLEAKVHLSYPFVIDRSDNKSQSRVIMPESSNAGNVFCFDSEHPEKGKIILENIPAIDATPLFYNNKWWIFCTLEGRFNNIELNIFYSDSFDGKWNSHKNNPVKTDIRSARPGGTPFFIGSKLFRPSQDCSVSYGTAIILNEIVRLDEFVFEEKQVKRIEPKQEWKFNKGLHTFSIVNKSILIDAKRYSFNFDNFNHVLSRKLKRIFRK
ncbi:hypothetical protein BH09BAC5_BH09BAC5_20730 [soil metagenome]